MNVSETFLKHRGGIMPLITRDDWQKAYEFTAKKLAWFDSDPEYDLISEASAPLTEKIEESQEDTSSPVATPPPVSHAMEELRRVVASKRYLATEKVITSEGHRIVDYLERAIYSLQQESSETTEFSIADVCLKMFSQGWTTSSPAVGKLVENIKAAVRAGSGIGRIRMSNGLLSLIAEKPLCPHEELQQHDDKGVVEVQEAAM